MPARESTTKRGARTPASSRASAGAASARKGARIRVTTRGWALVASAVVLFIAAYTSGRHELLYLACFAALLPIVALVMVWSRKLRVSVTRTFAPHLVEAGGTTHVTIDVGNLSPSRSTAADWSDGIPWFPFSAGSGRLRELSPRGIRFASSNSRRIEYDLTPPRRGVFDVGPLALDYRDPLGLVVGYLDAGSYQELVVIPAVAVLPESGDSIAQGEGLARVIQRKATGNDDDIMTREYRTGDALRRVHWRATARHGDLMVRQEEQRTYPEARLIFDTRTTGYRDVSTDRSGEDAESESFEWAVRMIASIGVHMHRSGYLVHIVETAPAQIAPLGDATQWTGRDEDFLRSLAGVQLATPSADSAPGGTRFKDEGPDGVSGPVFAVIAHPDANTIDWIARQRRPYEPAVAFVLTGISGSSVDYIETQLGIPVPRSSTVERLESAGWLVVPLRLSDDAAVAWATVIAQAGHSRAPA